jgi:predicted nucleic acid-binding protein
VMLLDTCVLVDMLRKQKNAVGFSASLAGLPSASVVTWTEVLAGANSVKDERVIQQALGNVRLLPVTADIARRAGEWLKHYRGSHGVDDFDAIIAATAEQHGLKLATLNLKHFPMFPKLKAAY